MTTNIPYWLKPPKLQVLAITTGLEDGEDDENSEKDRAYLETIQQQFDRYDLQRELDVLERQVIGSCTIFIFLTWRFRTPYG